MSRGLAESRRKRAEELRNETRTLADVLSIFRKSVGLLDEVDVLLHPLRSELNWPHGERKPIHFAPLRWQLPFHLLDGILYPMSRKCTAAWHEGPEAQQLLGQITEAVDEGARDFSVQRTPHFVLLQRPFYDARLRPLLTHWALLWLRRNRVQHGSDEQIAAYIGRDPDADGSGTVLADGSLGGKPEMSRDEPRLSQD